MRSNKMFVALCSFLLAMAVFAGGGCLGGSSSSGVSAISLLSVDSRGIPKLFLLPGTEMDDIVMMNENGKIDVKAPMSVISAVGYPSDESRARE